MFDGLAGSGGFARGVGRRELDPLDGINRALRGLWPLDEAGGVARDLSPLRRPGVRTSGTATVFAGPRVGARAANLTSGRYVNVPTFAWPGGCGVTVSAWINTGTNGNNRLFDVGGGAGEPNLFFAHVPYSDNTVYWRYGTYGTDLTTSLAAYLNTWIHIVFVNNGTNFKAIYINGRPVATGTSVATPPVATTVLKIGDGAWGGYVSNFRIWQRGLAGAEIRRLYADPWAGTYIEAERLFFAPAPSAATPATASPGPGAITLAGQAVTATAGATASPGAGAVAIAGQTATATAGATAAPGVGAVTLAGRAATATAGATASPGAGAIALAGLAAEASAGATASPGAGAIVWQGRQVTADNGAAPNPAPASRTVTAFLLSREVVARHEDRTVTAPYFNRTLTARE